MKPSLHQVLLCFYYVFFVILESYHTFSTQVDHAVITLGSSVVATIHQYFRIHLGISVNYPYSILAGNAWDFLLLITYVSRSNADSLQRRIFLRFNYVIKES